MILITWDKNKHETTVSAPNNSTGTNTKIAKTINDTTICEI